MPKKQWKWQNGVKEIAFLPYHNVLWIVNVCEKKTQIKKKKRNAKMKKKSFNGFIGRTKWNLQIFNTTKNLSLTLSWRRPLTYRNQSIDLWNKSMDWFLYDNGLRHERVKQTRLIKPTQFENSESFLQKAFTVFKFCWFH